MWVFDGEKWFQEGGESESQTSSQTPKHEMWNPRDEFRPELQVIEVVISVPKSDYVPPFPLP
jgi:hypothetical protein